jgi:hypothetical protein
VFRRDIVRDLLAGSIGGVCLKSVAHRSGRRSLSWVRRLFSFRRSSDAMREASEYFNHRRKVIRTFGLTADSTLDSTSLV